MKAPGSSTKPKPSDSSPENNDSASQHDSARTSWVPLAVVCATVFIVAIDSTMMAVAIGAIVVDLNTTIGAVQAGIAVYSLIMAAFMIAGGKLGTIYGTNLVFSIALVIYTIGTLMAALSPNIGILVLGWSVVEGLAAAALVPIAMALIVVNYKGKQRALAFGFVGGVTATAAALGPIVGGILTTEFSWRWGFALEAIIAIGVLLFMGKLKGSPPNRSERLDVFGMVLAALGFGLIVLGALLAGPYGWWNARRPFEIFGTEFNPFGMSPAPLIILVGVVLVIGLIHWLHGREGRGQSPLFRLGLLKHRNFTVGFSTMALMTGILAGALFFFPLFMLSGLGLNPLQAGVALLPLSFSLLVVSLTSPGLGQKIPPKYLVQAGIVLVGAGVFLYREVVALDNGIGQMALPFILIGAGMGLFLAQINNITLSAIPEQESSVGAGLTNTVNELGRSLGVAIIGSAFTAAVFFGIVNTSAQIQAVELNEEQAQQLAIELEDASARFSDPEAFQENVLDHAPKVIADQFRDIQDESLLGAVRNTLGMMFLLLVLLLLVSTFLERSKPPLVQRLAPAHSRDPEKPVPM